MMALAHQRYGKLPWAALFQPAIKLARDGFTITPRLHNALAQVSGDRRAVGRGAGAILSARRTAASRSARSSRIPRSPRSSSGSRGAGPDSFYVGPNAQAIAAAVSGAPHNPAPMTAGDIASYEAKPRPPVCGTYRGYRICGMGPSSSGGFTVFAILKQLERFDLSALGPALADRVASDRRIRAARLCRSRQISRAIADYRAGAGRRADRPGLSRAPLGADLARPSTIGRFAPPARPPARRAHLHAARSQPERGTSHFVAVDRWGNVASETSTIESSFGSGLMVNGYYLNNELTDFSFVPEKDGCPVANRVEGGKRPRSSMSPTIVYGPDGRVRLAVGAAGGATIPAQVAKAIIGVIDWHLPRAGGDRAADDLSRRATRSIVESGTFLEAMVPQLQALGHADRLSPAGTFKANAIEWVNGRWVGAADPRSEGAAVSRIERTGELARQLEHFDNLVSMFLTRAAEKGDAPFLWAKRDGEWRSISWAEAARQVAALAASLKRDRAAARRPGCAGQREPARMADRRPRDHGRGLRDGADLHDQHRRAITRTSSSNSGARAVIVSTQKLAKNLIPAVLTSTDCQHVIGIERHPLGPGARLGRLPQLGGA